MESIEQNKNKVLYDQDRHIVIEMGKGKETDKIKIGELGFYRFL